MFAKALGELDGGNAESQLDHALRDVARAVALTDSKVKGKVTLELVLEPAKGSGQLLVTHKIAYVRPTDTGRLSEETNGETAMYATDKGALSVLPHDQLALNLETRA